MARRWNSDGSLNQEWPDDPWDDEQNDGDLLDSDRSNVLTVHVEIDMDETDPSEFRMIAGAVACRVLAAMRSAGG